jgi:opacity protein-like surface antigen
MVSKVRNGLLVVAMLALVASPALAQSRAEVAVTFGWTFADGVSFNGTPVNGVTYSRVDPKDSVSFGFSAGVFLNHQAEIEFLWNHQPTKLEVSGGAGPVLSGDMNVDNYHANFVYNAGEYDSKLRPFIYIGLGATNYGDATFPSRTVPGLTKFSWALGAGVKAYPSPHAGIRAGIRWVPTYIKTDSAGWWCDPFYGCFPAGNVQYANQFEMSGGVTFRFEPEPEALPESMPEDRY